jgi:hypothetical protein
VREGEGEEGGPAGMPGSLVGKPPKKNWPPPKELVRATSFRRSLPSLAVRAWGSNPTPWALGSLGFCRSKKKVPGPESRVTGLS